MKLSKSFYRWNFLSDTVTLAVTFIVFIVDLWQNLNCRFLRNLSMTLGTTFQSRWFESITLSTCRSRQPLDQFVTSATPTHLFSTFLWSKVFVRSCASDWRSTTVSSATYLDKQVSKHVCMYVCSGVTHAGVDGHRHVCTTMIRLRVFM